MTYIYIYIYIYNIHTYNKHTINSDNTIMSYTIHKPHIRYNSNKLDNATHYYESLLSFGEKHSAPAYWLPSLMGT